MAGNDLREWDETVESILLNEEAIAVNQDPLGIQGTRDRKSGDREVWSKRLAGGDVAVILFNRGDRPRAIETGVSTTDVAVEAGEYGVRDLWNDEEWTTSGDLHADVDGHGVAFFRASPVR